MVFSRVGPNQSIEWGQIRISKSLDCGIGGNRNFLDKIYVYPYPNPIRAIRFKLAQHAKTTVSGAFGWSKTKKTFTALLGQPNDPTFCGHYLRCSFRPPLSVRLPDGHEVSCATEPMWDASSHVRGHSECTSQFHYKKSRL